MTKSFIYEIIVGIIVFIAIIAFGTMGNLAFLLMLLFPLVIKKGKPDEREYQLFYKAGNYSTSFVIIFITIIFLISQYVPSTYALITDNWLNFTVASFLLGHGLAGLIVFRSE